MNKADDILVFGSGDSMEEAEKDHDINLWNLMLRCRDVNLKLNPRKLISVQSEASYLDRPAP